MECVNYFKKLKEQYSHISDNHIRDVIDGTKELLIHLLYPSVLSVTENQENAAYKAYKYWLLKAMKDIISRNGMENVISYKENGLSITFDSSYLSSSLLKEITPVMGIV